MWLCGLCEAHVVNRYYLTHSQAIPKSHSQEGVGGLKGIHGGTSAFLSGRRRRREQVSPGDPIAWGVKDLLWTHHSTAEAVILGIYSRVRRHGAESRSKGHREAFEGQLSHSSCIPQPPCAIYLLSLRTAGACRERISLIPYWFQLNTTISRKFLVLSREKAWVG